MAMHAHVSPRSGRVKKAPLWLSECITHDACNSAETQSERSDSDPEEFFLEPSKLPYRPKKLKTMHELSPIHKAAPDAHFESLAVVDSEGVEDQPEASPLWHEQSPLPEQDTGELTGGQITLEPTNLPQTEPEEESPGPQLPNFILELPRELLVRVLGCLPVNILLQASGVCKAFAHASEAVFEDHCRRKRWKPPRRPRGEQAEIRLFPWRSLFRRHACQGCGKGGEFPVRVDFSGALAFLVCRRCAMNNRERLSEASLYIDLVGISGKRLITNNKKNRYVTRRVMPMTDTM